MENKILNWYQAIDDNQRLYDFKLILSLTDCYPQLTVLQLMKETVELLLLLLLLVGRRCLACNALTTDSWHNEDEATELLPFTRENKWPS